MERWRRASTGSLCRHNDSGVLFMGGAITIVDGERIRGSEPARLLRKNPVNDPERVDAFVYIHVYYIYIYIYRVSYMKLTT